MPIKTRLQVSFLAFGLVIILATGWQAYRSGRNAIEELTFHRLTSVRETKKRQIESYIEHLRTSIVTVAENREVRQICSVLGNMRVRLVDEARKAEETEQSHRVVANADSVFEVYISRFRLKSVAFVEPRKGMLVYSSRATPMLGQDILDRTSGDTSLMKTVSVSLHDAPGSIASISDITNNALETNRRSFYLGAPVVSGGRLAGVLVFEVGVGRMNSIMTDDDEWRKRGMGQSGETYIVGPDMLMRTDSRFLTDDPARYIQSLRRQGCTEDTIALIRKRRSTILLQRVSTVATKASLEGKTGIHIIHDYRDESVLSSFSPLGIPGLHWVIIAEIDTREAFAPIVHLQENLIFFGLVMFLLAAAIGYLLSRTIARPLMQLAKASELAGQGNLDWRVEVKSDDELGHLAATFNEMAANLRQMTTDLHSEIRVRQAAEEELQQNHERLKQLSAHLQSVREEERQYLAREIHDELGQALTAIKMDAVMLQRKFAGAGGEFEERMADMVSVINDTIATVRRLSTELRPGILDDLGLVAAMEWLAEDFQKRTGIACVVVARPESIILNPVVSTAVYRVFQESLTNVMRHANATSVDSTITQEDDSVYLRIIDDGCGIDEEAIQRPSSLGISGMRERMNALGGVFEIRRVETGGTAVSIHIPLHQTEAVS